LPALLGLLTVLAFFVVGVAIVALDHVFIGIMVLAAGIPAGLIVWVTRD